LPLYNIFIRSRTQGIIRFAQYPLWRTQSKHNLLIFKPLFAKQRVGVGVSSWSFQGITIGEPFGKYLAKQMQTLFKPNGLKRILFFHDLHQTSLVRSFKNKTIPTVLSGWFAFALRREGDSNPRYSYPYGSLANCWFKPLTHLSLRPPKP
jgi:hypothetical protein